MSDVIDFREERIRRAQAKVRRALAGLTEEQAKAVIEEALREVDSDLEVKEK